MEAETDGRLLVRIPEAAERLGLSRSTVYELIAAEEIHVIRIGRAVRVPVDELRSYVARARVGAGLEPMAPIPRQNTPFSANNSEREG